MTHDLFSLAATLRPAAKGLTPQKMWLVGGFIRDALMGRPLHDVDLAVDGDAKKAADNLAAALKGKAFPLDKERGVYRVAHQARVYDFCRLQGGAIEKDLKRRDFTINALALPLTDLTPLWKKKIIDLSGGLKDLKAKKIRTAGASAFKEDPLRLLRAFRFAAELDFSIDPKTFAAIKKWSKGIVKSAPERVREEILKICASGRAAPAFAAMDRADLLAVLFPETTDMRKTAHDYYGKQGVLGHCLDSLRSLETFLRELPLYFPAFHRELNLHLREPVAGFPRFALMTLAEFLHDIGKPSTARLEGGKLHFYGHEHVGAVMATKIADRLRLSNAEGHTLSHLIAGHMRPGNLGHQSEVTDRAVYRFYRDLEGDAVALLIMALGDHFTYLSEKEKAGGKDPVFLAVEKMLSSYFLQRERVQPPKIIDGNVLIKKLKLKPCAIIGKLLEAIKEAQAARKVKTQPQALQLAEKLLKSKKLEDSLPQAALEV